MKRLARILGLLVVGAAASAVAAPVSRAPDDHATLCLDTLGTNRGLVCRSHSASRLDTSPDICVCQGAALQVDAPWCAPGETPQPDSAAFERARRDAAQRDGTLVGKNYAGRSFCVARGRGD